MIRRSTDTPGRPRRFGPKPTSPGWVRWVTGLAFAGLLALLSWRVLRFGERASCVSVETGMALMVVSILSLGAWLTGLGRRPWAGLLLTLLVLDCMQVAEVARRRQERRWVSEFLREERAMLGELQNGMPVQLRTPDQRRFGPYSLAVVRFSHAFAGVQARLATAFRAFEAEPIAILPASRSVAALDEARHRLEAARAALGGFREEVRERMFAAMDDPAVAPAVREGVLQAVESSPTRGDVGGADTFFDAVEELLEFLRTHQGRYRYEAGTLVFADAADGAAYDDLADHVDTLRGAVLSRLAQSRQAAAAQTQERFDRLENRVR